MSVPPPFGSFSPGGDAPPERVAKDSGRSDSGKATLTRQGFDEFLATLDSDREAAGRKYEVLRSKLISFFDWRNCPSPEDQADEAISRVILKIEAGEELRDPSTFVFGVARMMLLEISRRAEKERAALTEFSLTPLIDTDRVEAQKRIDRLRKCLAELPEKRRTLITEYYADDGAAKIRRRKSLAARLGLQMNALRIRACRVRDQLEECMRRGLAN